AAPALSRCDRHTHCLDHLLTALGDTASPGALYWLGPMELQHGQAWNGGAAIAADARPSDDRVIETSIPSRLDSLLWSGFHTRVVAALGITWILDGLEVTLAGALSGALKQSPTLHFSNFDVGL